MSLSTLTLSDRTQSRQFSSTSQISILSISTRPHRHSIFISIVDSQVALISYKFIGDDRFKTQFNSKLISEHFRDQLSSIMRLITDEVKFSFHSPKKISWWSSLHSNRESSIRRSCYDPNPTSPRKESQSFATTPSTRLIHSRKWSGKLIAWCTWTKLSISYNVS